MKKNKIVYSEPVDYFPEEIRKEYGLGEYYKDEQDEKTKEVNKQFRD